MFGKKPAAPRAGKGAPPHAGAAPHAGHDDAPVRPRLADAAGGLLSLIVLLRRTPDLDGLRDLRMTVERLIAEFRGRARDQGAPQADVDDATYALAATIDELLLNARWNGRDIWERDSLARTWCNDEFVGLGFYDKLTQIRRGGSARPEVVEVFYYCLLAGFQGKLVEEPGQLKALVEELSRDLAAPVKQLSPRGQMPAEGAAVGALKRFPWPAVVITAVFLPLLVLLLAYGMLDRHRDSILRALAGN